MGNVDVQVHYPPGCLRVQAQGELTTGQVTKSDGAAHVQGFGGSEVGLLLRPLTERFFEVQGVGQVDVGVDVDPAVEGHLVEEDVDIHDETQVEWARTFRVQADRDVIVIEGAQGKHVDPSVRPWELAKGQLPMTAKMGIDATRKWAAEGYARSWPARIATTQDAGRKAAEIWTRVGGRARA